jgi:endonuclease YncB( thermonuclease family)
MRTTLIATGLVLLLAATPALSDDLNCRVVGISDGDTFTCLTISKRQVKVRLAEIDTPESKQPYGTRARQQLSEFAFGKDVTLSIQDTDRYGRTVARAFVGDTDINAEMVRHGAAWVYRQYSHDRGLLALETEAREEMVGLWALPESERMPPWEWRRAHQRGR